MARRGSGLLRKERPLSRAYGRREQRRSSSTRDARGVTRERQRKERERRRKTHSELHPDVVAEAKRLRRRARKPASG